ncbi:MAG: GNAT family N-acetyltransferase [Spirochaetes bacterium]|nr:GNAT family N-acetyltransferase [Spirochaetota bacterium]
MEIIPLHMVPELGPLLARWSYNEWYRHRSIDFSLVLHTYLARTKDNSLPQSFVAMDEGRPAGMVTLKLDDLWSRKDLNPWLSSLYVVPEARSRGTGHALVRTVLARARELGFASVNLFLGQANMEQLERYYAKRGWEVVGAALDNDGVDTKIMMFRMG